MKITSLDQIPQKIREEAVSVALSPSRCWSDVYVNYDNDFCEWFVNPFICDAVEDGAVTVAKVSESTKQLVLL